MHKRNDRQWINYCRALDIDCKDQRIKQDEYYIKGFKEWMRLQKEYRYYNYMETSY